MPTGKGLPEALREAQKLGCSAAQVFTSSPRMWKSAPATDEKCQAFRAAMEETGIRALVSHDTYLVNLCHLDEEIARKSAETLRDEITRCGAYGIPFVVSHMGATVGQDVQTSLRRISENTAWILGETPADVTLLMENTAGQGSAVNSRLEELAELLRLGGANPRLAVCIDTCHLFAAGYDIRDRAGFEAFMADFDRLIGLDRLKAVHLNDSKKSLGSRVDRHANIGQGELGLNAFKWWLHDPRLEFVPMVIETPTENEGHEKDLALLRSLLVD
jgi:deoxyribonuclease-4